MLTKQNSCTNVYYSTKKTLCSPVVMKRREHTTLLLYLEPVVPGDLVEEGEVWAVVVVDLLPLQDGPRRHQHHGLPLITKINNT